MQRRTWTSAYYSSILYGVGITGRSEDLFIFTSLTWRTLLQYPMVTSPVHDKGKIGTKWRDETGPPQSIFHALKVVVSKMLCWSEQSKTGHDLYVPRENSENNKQLCNTRCQYSVLQTWQNMPHWIQYGLIIIAYTAYYRYDINDRWENCNIKTALLYSLSWLFYHEQSRKSQVAWLHHHWLLIWKGAIKHK